MEVKACMKWIKFFSFIFILMMFFVILQGCKIEETNVKKIKNLDYTVCDESRLPNELVCLIQDKKKQPFKLTYRTKDYLYIAIGYGAQDRTDLSVKLLELYLTKNAIFVDTELTSREDTTLEDHKVSYPWIVVKCEHYDLPVNFK